MTRPDLEGAFHVRILVTGGLGQLGHALGAAADEHEILRYGSRGLDVTDAAAVAERIAADRPDAIIHAAAWTDVDGCERDPDRARAVHEVGTRNVARAAGDALLVAISTDYVFDGTLGRAYVEDDQTDPLQVYGRTKLAAEHAARAEAERVAVVRTSWLYGARTDEGTASNFLTTILRAAARGPIRVVDDQRGSPTWVADLADALVALCERGATGTFHVVNEGAASRYEQARAAVEAAGLAATIEAVATADLPERDAPRPVATPLDGAAWRAAGFAPLPGWRDAIARAIPGIVAALRADGDLA